MMKMRKDDEIKTKSTQDIHNGEKLLITEIMSQRKEPEKKEFKETKNVLPPSDVTMSHLQFNLPDGSSFSQDFKSSILLQDVLEYVKNNLNLKSSNVILSTSSPIYKEFTRDDQSLNLLDLHLSPMTILNLTPLLPIIKEPDGTRHRNTIEAPTRSFFLFAIIYAFFGFFARIIFGTPTFTSRVEESRPLLTIVTERSEENTSANKRPPGSKAPKKQAKTFKGDESSEKTSTSTGGSAKSSKSSKSLTKLIKLNPKDNKVKLLTADP